MHGPCCRGSLFFAAAVIAFAAPAACGGRPLPAAMGTAGIGGAAGGSAGGAGAGGGPAASASTLDWGIAVGQPASPSTPGSASVSAVIALDDGGAMVAGDFTGTVSFAADRTLSAADGGSAFVAKYRSDQRLVWVTALVSSGQAVAADLASAGSGEAVVAGWFSGTLSLPGSTGTGGLTSAGALDLFAARVASDGSIRWARAAGGPGDDIARAVATRVDSAGGVSVVVSGALGNDGATFAPAAGAGPNGMWVAPPESGPVYAAWLDGDGQFTALATAGGGVPGQGYGVAMDTDGAALVTGYVNGVAPFGVDPSGTPVSVDPSNGRAFVARWTRGGALAWARGLGGSAAEGSSVTVDAAGDAVVCGLFQGTATFGAGPGAPTLTADTPGRNGAFLAALSAGGQTRWARRLAGIGVHPWRVRPGVGGGLLVAASFGGGVVIDPDGPASQRIFSAGGDDAAFLDLGGDGALARATAGGGPGDDEAGDMATASGGARWAVGHYIGPAAFGTGSDFGKGAAVSLDSGTDGAGFLLRLLP